MVLGSLVYWVIPRPREANFPMVWIRIARSAAPRAVFISGGSPGSVASIARASVSFFAQASRGLASVMDRRATWSSPWKRLRWDGICLENTTASSGSTAHPNLRATNTSAASAQDSPVAPGRLG